MEMTRQDAEYIDRAAREYAAGMEPDDYVLGGDIIDQFATWYLAECRNELPEYWPAFKFDTWQRFLTETGAEPVVTRAQREDWSL